jgi:thioesterase domain-containing protein/acyl carrier protein
MLEHRGIVNFIQHQIAYFGITEEENILHLANIAFDPSVEQLFLALLSGARVTILSKAAMLEEGYISSVIKTEGITHLHSVPSLLQTIPYDDYPELKRVISAGEACKVQLAEQWSKTYDFYNKYGPSEASISCAEYKYEAAAVSGNIVPIGYPTANTQIYILDESLNLLPVGVVGEICISGAGLARGYWNKPELTAQRFVTHPFIPEAKLYRTGDLGRWDANGNIEFIGRKDNQVKIRGHRVELGEINYQLQQSGVLNQGIVVSHTSNTGENYLAAYVVPSTNYDIDSIRTYLQKCLPGYMVPAVFVELETLPLTPNGKIDYKALPKPGEQRRTQNAYLAARNSIESRLVEIWSQFLDASPVGVQDNFFDLGGHSLLALQIMAKINQSFEKRLPIADLFEFPTIEALAQQIAQSEEITDEARLISLNQNSATYNWFCVPAAEGNVMAFSNWAKQLEGTANVYAFQPQGLMGLSAPLQTVEAMAETYLELLLDTQDQGPFYLAGYSFGAKVAYQIAFLLEQRGYEVAQVIIFDAVAAHKQLEKPNLEQVDYAFWLAELGAHLAGLYGKTCNLSPTDFNQANQAAQFEYLFDKMTALGLDISFEQVKGFAQVYLNNIHCNYEPKLEQLPNFPIHLYKARDVSSMDERLQQGILKTEDYGWQDLTTGRVRATWLEGDHWSVLSAAHTALVTENLVHPIPQLISSAYES